MEWLQLYLLEVSWRRLLYRCTVARPCCLLKVLVDGEEHVTRHDKVGRLFQVALLKNFVFKNMLRGTRSTRSTKSYYLSIYLSIMSIDLSFYLPCQSMSSIYIYLFTLLVYRVVFPHY